MVKLSLRCERELCEDAIVTVTLLSVAEGSLVQEESDIVVQDRLVPLGARTPRWTASAVSPV